MHVVQNAIKMLSSVTQLLFELQHSTKVTSIRSKITIKTSTTSYDSTGLDCKVNKIM